MLLGLSIGYNNSLLARTNLDSLKSELGKVKGDEKKFELFCSLGSSYAYTNVGSYEKFANNFFDSAFSIAVRTNSLKKQLHVELLRTYLMPRNSILDLNVKKDKLIDLVNSSLKLNSLDDQAYALLQLGYVLMILDTPSAQTDIYRASEIYKQINDTIGIAVCESVLAEFFMRNGLTKDAYKHAKNAEQFFEKSNSNPYFTHYKLYNLMQMADFADRNKDKNNYTSYLMNVIKAAVKIDSVTYIDIAYNRLYNIYKIEKKYDSAFYAMKNYYSYIEFTNSNEHLYQYYRNIAEIYQLNGNNNLTDSFMNVALANIQYVRRNYEICHAYLNASYFYFNIKKYVKSIELGTAALNIAEKDHRYDLLSDCYYILYNNNKECKNLKKALEYLEKYNETLNKRIEKIKNNEIVKLQMQKEYELNERKKVSEKYLSQQAQTAENQKIRFILYCLSICIFGLIIIVMTLNIQKLRTKNILKKEIAEQNQYLAISILNAQEEERSKIAADIHDGLGAYLSSLRINLNIIKKDIPESRLYLANNMTEAVNKISKEIRSIADFLVSDTLHKYGMIIAIEELVELINASKRVNIVFEHEGNFESVCSSIQICIFRVVQELFNNLLKHSGASNCKLSIKNKNGVNINYFDDGVGLHNDLNSSIEGKGLMNMQTRIKIHGGTFSILSSSKDTLAIIINIPNA